MLIGDHIEEHEIVPDEEPVPKRPQEERDSPPPPVQDGDEEGAWAF